MNYQKIHDKIIENARLQNRQKLSRNNKNYVYYENHHIVPRCLNGSDDITNLVLLIPKEHYIIHKLLTYIYKGNLKIAQAFFLMVFNKKKKLKLSLRDYTYAKELINSIPTLKASDETRKKISKILKLSSEERILYKKKEKEINKFNKWFYKNNSPEAIEKYIESLKNIHYSSHEDPIIHFSFENKEANKQKTEELIKNIQDLNNKGYYVPSNFKKK